MSNPASTMDLEDRWRPLTDTEQTVAQALLDDAWAVLQSEVPGLDDRVTSGALASPLVIGVVAAMVLRVLRNPEGKLQERIDDYSYTRDSSVATGGLYVTVDELRLLIGVRGSAFSITPSWS